MPRIANDGLGRLGGREKGTPNKKSQLVESLLDIDNINLPLEVLKCCESLRPLEKANVLLKLMEFIYPKRKAVDLNLEPEKQVSQVTVHIMSNGRDRDEGV